MSAGIYQALLERGLTIRLTKQVFGMMESGIGLYVKPLNFAHGLGRVTQPLYGFCWELVIAPSNMEMNIIG
jgi:hypothetical protein